MTDTFVEIDGLRLRYKELNKGASRPLLMFNGTALNYETWKPLSWNLDRHMIMIDLPGCGKSDIYRKPPSMDKYAADMLTAALTIHKNTIEEFDVVGYSFGGALAQVFAERYPENTNKLVLLSTTPGFSGQIPNARALMMSMTFGKALVAKVFGRKCEDGEVISNFKAPHPFGPIYSTGALIRWGQMERKVNDQHPALIVHGRDDHLLPLKNAQVLKNLYTNSKLEVLSGDHMAPMAQADYVANLMKDFLEV